MNDEIKNNLTEPDEKEIRTRDVLDAVCGFILIVSAIVALFALIWGAWHTLQVSTTILATAVLCNVGVVFLVDKFGRK